MKNLALLLAASFLVLSCTKKTDENEIVIGSYSSNTGATATFGVYQLRGTEMAVNEINAAPSTRTHPIILHHSQRVYNSKKC